MTPRAPFGFFVAGRFSAWLGYGLHPVVTYVRDRSRPARAVHSAAP